MFKSQVKFHDCLHGLRTAHVTDATQMTRMLFQQLSGIGQAAVFKLSLDLFKTFDSFLKQHMIFLEVTDANMTSLMHFVLWWMALLWHEPQVMIVLFSC